MGSWVGGVLQLVRRPPRGGWRSQRPASRCLLLLSLRLSAAEPITLSRGCAQRMGPGPDDSREHQVDANQGRPVTQSLLKAAAERGACNNPTVGPAELARTVTWLLRGALRRLYYE